MFLKVSDLQCYLIQTLVVGLVIIIFQTGNLEKLRNVSKVYEARIKQNKNSKLICHIPRSKKKLKIVSFLYVHSINKAKFQDTVLMLINYKDENFFCKYIYIFVHTYLCIYTVKIFQ